MDYRKIIEYIINSCEAGQLVTVVDASHKFDCSVSSIRKYIAKLKKSSDESDKVLYNSYLEVSNMNRLRGQILGGKNGKRNSSLSDSLVSDLCEYVIQNDCTLRQLEKEVGIPKSTLYENLSKLNDSRLQDIYDEHHRNALNGYNNDVENNGRFNSVGSEISESVTRVRK